MCVCVCMCVCVHVCVYVCACVHVCVCVCFHAYSVVNNVSSVLLESFVYVYMFSYLVVQCYSILCADLSSFWFASTCIHAVCYAIVQMKFY